jgi:hypothetical protein
MVDIDCLSVRDVEEIDLSKELNLSNVPVDYLSLGFSESFIVIFLIVKIMFFSI